MSPLSDSQLFDSIRQICIDNMNDIEKKIVFAEAKMRTIRQAIGNNYFYDGCFSDDCDVKPLDDYRNDLWECAYCKSTNYRDSLNCIHCGAGQLRSIFVGA